MWPFVGPAENVESSRPGGQGNNDGGRRKAAWAGRRIQGMRGTFLRGAIGNHWSSAGRDVRILLSAGGQSGDGRAGDNGIGPTPGQERHASRAASACGAGHGYFGLRASATSVA